jgi:hypothetical protein
MKCDYKNSLQVCMGDAKAVKELTITYPDGGIDVLRLCKTCAEDVYFKARESNCDVEERIL